MHAARAFSLSALFLLATCSLRAQDPTLTPPSSSAASNQQQAAPQSQSKAPANPKIQQLLTQLERVTPLHSTAISPDGAELAWSVGGSKAGAGVYLADASGAHPRLLPRPGAKSAGCGEGSLAWSPDSKRLAFFSDCADGKQTEIFLLDAKQSAAAPRQLTHLHGSVEGLAWSPDGKHLSFLYVPGATRPAGALAAMKPPSGVIGVEGLEVQQVAAADPATGDVAMITPASLHVYEFDWSPDGQKLAYVAAPPPGENNWWVAKLYTQGVSLSGGASPSKLGGRAAFDPGVLLDPGTVSGPLHGLQIAVPRWSPDGSEIAFIGGLMSDQGATGGDIYTVSTQGGAAPVDITSESHLSYTWITWLAPASNGSGEKVLGASAIADGHSTFTKLAIPATASAGAASTGLFELPASIGDGRMEMSLSLTKDGQKAAFLSSSFDSAPEVYTAQLASGSTPQQITHLNDTLKPDWGKAESVTWENGGFHVQGWLLQPANYDPAKKYPMIVMVHGGPSSAVLPRWPGSRLRRRPLLLPRLLRSLSQSAGQLWRRGKVHAGQRQGFRLR